QTDQDDIIDLETFTQLLDLDEDDTHDFSLGMTEAYFTQASTTFTDMDEAFEQKDLPKLSALGHFLKGSSAALGVSAVQATCEDIQHYGALRDEVKGTDLTPEEALAKIGPLLKRVKKEYGIAEKWLQRWYKEHAAPVEV
ncbi:histidine phosphotransferase, partial [Lentinus brumalis]